MNRKRSSDHDVIVIGGGQSGLAAGYHLAKRALDFVILEGSPRIGDVWRERYDSLLLYSPAKYDELPGMPFPLERRHAFPTGRQMGDYLEAYSDHLDLPVETGVRVDAVRPSDDGGGGYVVGAGDRQFRASHVIAATGAFQKPHVPAFAADLDPSIRQIHSADYRTPDQLADGPVLVVGAAHSGADLAFELAHTRPTYLSGRSQGQLPFSVDSPRARLAWPIMKFAALHVLTLRTPMGRKAAPRIRRGGGPLLRHRRKDLLDAGVRWYEERTVGVDGGMPKLADGRVLDVANVVWCTGFRPDYSWIQPPIVGEDGWPVERRGVVESRPGLYVLGIPFLSGFSSMLVLGAARDANHVVGEIERALRSAAGERGTSNATAAG